MKNSKLLVVLFAMTILSAMFLYITPVSAVHKAKVTLTPVYYNGGAETKIFNVTNLPESSHPIIEVVITFPPVVDGDTPFKPVDYEFPDGWKARYEAALKQVIFESLSPDTSNIPPKEYGIFKIVFTDGPSYEGQYEWTVSTTDSNKDGHTYYPSQYIDRTKPVVIIDHPLDDSVVYAIWEDYKEGMHYLWINVTAYDELSKIISSVKVKICNVTWCSDWEDITDSKIGNKYYTKWYNLAKGSYNVTAIAEDGAGNYNTDTNDFYYNPRKTGLEILNPDKKGTVGPTTQINPETGWVEGSIYTYGHKQLGTEVMLEGTRFNENSNVNITVYIDTYYLMGGQLLVKQVETNSTGGFRTSFIFPTAPKGTYIIKTEDNGDPQRSAEDLFTVVPEIIYKPVIIIGPAPIEAIATGLSAEVHAQGFTCNDTDALLGANWQVLDWYTNTNGTLQTPWADKPGFLMPVLESGTYEIGLDFEFYDVYRAYGEEDHTSSISNYLYVVSAFDELSDKLDELELKLDFIKPKIVAINDNIVDITTEVGNIEVKLDDLKPVIARIDGNVVKINTTIGSINGIIMSIEDDVAVIRGEGEEWDIRLKLDEVVPSPMPTYLSAILSAIAAIASITAVVVVVKRLKVAA